MKRFLRRCLTLLLAGVALVGVAIAIPIGYVETACRAPGGAAVAQPPAKIADAGYRRAVGDSYMTYPEWYIVHAYADLAAVTRQTSESRFDYAGSVRTFWSSLCGATRTAGTIGPVTRDQRITDDIIGISFSLEMAAQGAWERTIGAFTAWTRGDHRTAEDIFNQRFLDHYAAFLQQTPWYRYPFGDELSRLWRQTPFRLSLRSIERRVALSLEFGTKAVYAAAIGALAGYAPADLTILSVVKGDHATDVPDVTRVRSLPDDDQLVKTPRYAAFTDIFKRWAANGTSIVEIAGNHRILVTVLVRKGSAFTLPDARPIFTVPLQARPGWERVGLDAHVEKLTDIVGAAEREGAVFEHVYDY